MESNDPNRPDPSEAAAPSTPAHDHPTFGRMMSFARRHPALSLIGIAGAGLLGGVELATGVLIGVGAAALIGRGPSAGGVGEPEVVREGEHRVRRASHDVMERARAVLQAARGHLAPQHRNGERKVDPSMQGEILPH